MDYASFGLPIWLESLGTLFTATWFLTNVAVNRLVRGSLPRYRWRTAERALRYPALADIVLKVSVSLANPVPGLFFLYALQLVLWIVNIHMSRGDDDDWFSDQRRKLTRWVQSLGRKPAPVGVRS